MTEEGLVEGLRRLIGQPATRREVGRMRNRAQKRSATQNDEVQSLRALLDRTKLRANSSRDTQSDPRWTPIPRRANVPTSPRN